VAGLGIGFGVLTRLTPCNRGMFWWKDLRAAVTDLVYWFIVPLFLQYCRRGLFIVGVVLVLGGGNPASWPRQLPLWAQCVAVLLIQDVILYWIHRIFHTRTAWRYHAIHHSPKVVDWTTMARFHPVNNLLEFGIADVAVLLMGFPLETLAVLMPFNTIYSGMVHANLNWTFGPLRYVFASPVFHRWHHTTQKAGLDKNFASTFPVLDLLFGTYYMPAGQLPEQFGNGDSEFPEGFMGQLMYPFRTPEQEPAASADVRGRRKKRVA
jgi:sterol desaturase/sphingolipid hydroxylase (fatty acid hydroxylase superfamily)